MTNGIDMEKVKSKIAVSYNLSKKMKIKIYDCFIEWIITTRFSSS